MNIDFEKELESITAQIIEKFKPEKIIFFWECFPEKDHSR